MIYNHKPGDIFDGDIIVIYKEETRLWPWVWRWLTKRPKPVVKELRRINRINDTTTLTLDNNKVEEKDSIDWIWILSILIWIIVFVGSL